jgi:GNAT superfamily N-acetyltransferase
MKPIIRTADERDWEAIAQLNHDTYSLELGQYEANADGRKIDRLHETNIYFVAYVGDELAGMISITLPSKAQFSTLKRLKSVNEDIRINLPKTAEMRLLAIKPAYRGQGIYDRLMAAVIQYTYLNDIERVLISAIENRVPLYAFMGFCAIGEAVVEGTAVYVPMLITRQSFATSPFCQKLTGKKLEVVPVA